MNLAAAPRVRRWVRGGPARLSSWIVVLTSPAGIAAAAGTLAVKLNGSTAWVNIDGATAWEEIGSSFAALAAHIAATGTAVHGLGTASTHPATDFDAAGAAAAVQGNLNTHVGQTGTAVHGLGSAAVLTAAAANGAATLGADTLVPAAQLPQSFLAETYIYPPVTGGIYSGTHVLNARTRSFEFWLVGAGGAGGGAVGGAVGDCSVGSGGGGGGFRSGRVAVVSGVTGVVWVIGQGGVGASGGVGTAGGASTLTYDGVLIATSEGGLAGQVMPSGNTPALVVAGSLGTASPGGTIAIVGSNGHPAIRWSGTVALAGAGGAGGYGPWSGGSRFSDSDGEAGLRHGGGGEGAFATTANRRGGDGKPGGMAILEFS